MNNYFKFIATNFSIIIASLILLGIVQINVYYRSFYGFDVMPYLSPSEILTQSFISLSNTSFIEVLLKIFGTAILVFVSVVLAANGFRTSLKRSILIIKENGNIQIPILTLFLFLVSPTINIIKSSYMELKENAIAVPEEKDIVYMVIATVVMVIVRRLAPDHGSVLTKWSVAINAYFLITLYVILYLSSTSYISYIKEGAKIKNNYYYLGTELKTADHVYVSDTNASYVGRTTSSAFFYDFKSKIMTVIPASELKYLKIKTKN